MSKNLFDKRKSEFLQAIKKDQRLPKLWEYVFTDGEDMRLWFNKISKVEQFKDFVAEVENVLGIYNKKILTDREREGEFLNCISSIKRIPARGEKYFSDNTDMFTWYMSYKKRDKGFENIVYINLPEYNDFDLVTVWPLIKQEFISILKKLKRIPEHGEVILQNDIDVRVVYDKLKSYDPEFFEKLLLHLQTYDKKGLSIDDRIIQLKKAVSNLGYIPQLQEMRFTDETDMFTWYTKYKKIFPNLEGEVNSLLHKEPPKHKVNIYLIPNFRNTDGKFYTIYTNVGEKLDLSNINSFEEIKKIDDTLVKRGEIMLAEDEEIDSVSFVKGKSKR